MTSAVVQRALLALAVCLSGNRVVLVAPAGKAQPQALVLDGLRDAGYQLLAQDPAGDLAAGLAVTSTTWADLTALYVTTDTLGLWVYADLPGYSGNSAGSFVLVLDTDGLNASGGAAGPGSDGITFAYTSTYNNVGSTPVITTGLLLPDALIRGHLYSPAGTNPQPSGWTELNRWTGSTWNHVNTDWGGITGTNIGTHVGFAYGHGIELSIPYSDLGIWPTSTVHLEFLALGPKALGPPTGAYDSLPDDSQAPALHAPTTQRRLATLHAAPPFNTPRLAFSSPGYAVSEAQGSAPITLTLSTTSTQPISFTFVSASGTASLADYIPISQVLTISPGLDMRVINLHVLTDTLSEPDETVQLSLSQPVNAQLGIPVTATLTIHDSPWSGLLAKLFLPLTRR